MTDLDPRPVYVCPACGYETIVPASYRGQVACGVCNTRMEPKGGDAHEDRMPMCNSTPTRVSTPRSEATPGGGEDVSAPSPEKAHPEEPQGRKAEDSFGTRLQKEAFRKWLSGEVSPEIIQNTYWLRNMVQEALTAARREAEEARIEYQRKRVADSERIGAEMCRAEKAEAEVERLKTLLHRTTDEGETCKHGKTVCIECMKGAPRKNFHEQGYRPTTD